MDKGNHRVTETRRRKFLWSVGLGLFGFILGCGARTPVQNAGLDQDIARDVNWTLRDDRRFEAVNAFCADGVVTLQGRVDSKAAEEDAVRISESRARGTRVVSKLEIRPR